MHILKFYQSSYACLSWGFIDQQISIIKMLNIFTLLYYTSTLLTTEHFSDQMYHYPLTPVPLTAYTPAIHLHSCHSLPIPMPSTTTHTHAIHHPLHHCHLPSSHTCCPPLQHTFHPPTPRLPSTTATHHHLPLVLLISTNTNSHQHFHQLTKTIHLPSTSPNTNPFPLLPSTTTPRCHYFPITTSLMITIKHHYYPLQPSLTSTLFKNHHLARHASLTPMTLPPAPIFYFYLCHTVDISKNLYYKNFL